MSRIIIDIKNLKRNFNMGGETVHALKGISFSVREGEFITIMGSSGSGKTTLLNLLGCLDKPGQGQYYFDETDVSSLSRNELAGFRNRKLGFIFQSYNLLPKTSAIENVELPLLYSNQFSASERRDQAITALEAVGLKQRLNHLPSQLSGGQQQRVAIARALISDPAIILADEATGNLDTRTSYEIMALIQELNNSKGKTIVFVTHEPDIAAFSKRTIVLKDGIIIKDQLNTAIKNAKEMLAQLPPAYEPETTGI